MRLIPENEEPGVVYSTMIRAITPRPIAWVSTVSPAGVANLAPFSFFNGVGSHPAALMFSAVNRPDGSRKDTVRNIESNGEFVVNVVSAWSAERMMGTSFDYEYGESEFEAVGLEVSPSERVAPPRVAESGIHFECELLQIVGVGEGPLAANIVIGKILLIEVADWLLDERGKIDPEKIDTIGRMGGLSFCRTRDRFDLKPPRR